MGKSKQKIAQENRRNLKQMRRKGVQPTNICRVDLPGVTKLWPGTFSDPMGAVLAVGLVSVRKFQIR